MGIDYGMGTTNIDKSNGIRYGVIPCGAVGQAWDNASEEFYGDPHCPTCGNEAESTDTSAVASPTTDTEYRNRERLDKLRSEYDQYKHCCADYCCDECKITFDGEYAFPDEAISYYIDDTEYGAESSDGIDIFVLRSPYYTKANFCSPCAPGACYLMSPDDSGSKAYCFNSDWFDDYDGTGEGLCPYPIWTVEGDELIYWPDGYYDFLFGASIGNSATGQIMHLD